MFPYCQCGPGLVVQNHFFPTSKCFQTWIKPCCGLFLQKSEPRGLLRGAPQAVVWGSSQVFSQVQVGHLSSVPRQKAHHLDINKENAVLLSLKCIRHYPTAFLCNPYYTITVSYIQTGLLRSHISLSQKN